MRRTIAALGGRSVLKNKKKKVTQLKKKGRKKVTQLKKEKKGHSAQNKGEIDFKILGKIEFPTKRTKNLRELQISCEKFINKFG